MTPFYLKFTDEAEAIAVLAQFRALDQDGRSFWITASATHALDVLGTIHAPTGRMLPTDDPQWPEVPEMQALAGFHVNALFAELPPALAPYLVTPANPACVFAGHERTAP